MLTESNKAQILQDIHSNVEWRYPLTSGATQYDFNPDSIYVYRSGEPVSKSYPAVKVSYPGRRPHGQQGLGNVIKDYSGALVYGYSEIEPLIISVYTHLESSGATHSWHGRLIADAYIRRIEKRARRYWPQILEDMEAYIHNPTSFLVDDISEFVRGDEMAGYELTINIITTNKWDYAKEDWDGVVDSFNDAVLSGAESGQAYTTYLSVSGEMHDT